MSTNVGTVDRILRAVIGIVLLYAALFSGMAIFSGGVMKIGAIVIGIVMLATAAFKFCPLYTLFGIKTCKAR